MQIVVFRRPQKTDDSCTCGTTFSGLLSPESVVNHLRLGGRALGALVDVLEGDFQSEACRLDQASDPEFPAVVGFGLQEHVKELGANSPQDTA